MAKPLPIPAVGRIFGRIRVIDATPVRQGNQSKILTECVECGQQALRSIHRLHRGEAGCMPCHRKTHPPAWLYRRCAQIKQRCESPKNLNWERYGGRGIEFCFPSILDMAIWVRDNLGLDPSKHIDRIDNDGHYEPGNLRLSTVRQNCAGTRKRRITAMVHRFKLDHPDVPYADQTLRRLFHCGLAPDQIRQRYLRTSQRYPIGVRGHRAPADPFIASRAPATPSAIAERARARMRKQDHRTARSAPLERSSGRRASR